MIAYVCTILVVAIVLIGLDDYKASHLNYHIKKK